MLLKYFYDKSLAHASYMIGCQRSGEAIVIDPGRNIAPYLEAAEAEGLKITGAAETHIHADFVSGSRELAERVGATLYLSDEGPDEWKYLFTDKQTTTLLHDGDAFYVGKVKLEVLHTPGHTPESISFVLTDEGGGANVPMGIFTGDFVFVGSIGRPDLLESAAGVIGSADVGARQLYRSIEKFRSLPDHLQVWPAHGAGSACGKGLGAIPSSTVGYEKLFNPALQFHEEESFVEYILKDQPETPFYFANMKHVNKAGPELIAHLPEVKELSPQEVAELAPVYVVFDVRPPKEFAAAHVPGTINLPEETMVQWAGFLADHRNPAYLIASPDRLQAILVGMRSIGIDSVRGFADLSEVSKSNQMTESYASASPKDLSDRIRSGEVRVLDVRAETEFREGHIDGAEHRFLGRLLKELKTIDRSKPLVAQCLGGGRSAIATSILQREGFQVTNMEGGYRAWVASGLPTTAA
jgi:hydroxyacylglutathione hydrolase